MTCRASPIRPVLIHFIGASGSGMRGLVRLCLQKGWSVSVTDRSGCPNSLFAEDSLCENKLQIVYEEESLQSFDPFCVVYSSAISQTHPHYLWAEKRGCLVPRASFLAAFFHQANERLAVTGTHGKTTVSSWLAHLFDEQTPTSYCLGGMLRSTGFSAHWNGLERSIIEADESDGSLVHYRPSSVLITNIDDDHLHYWKSVENLEAFLLEYAKKSSRAILCQDDPRMACWPIEAVRYGFHPSSDLRIDSFRLTREGSEVSLSYCGKSLGLFSTSLLGRHNVQNLAAVVATGVVSGIEIEKIRSSVASFQGVARRLEFLGSLQGRDYFDDYGVHPTEIEASIQALRLLLKADEKFCLILQPHRGTRLKSLMKAFVQSMALVDQLWLAPLYVADETGEPSVETKILEAQLRSFYPQKEIHRFESLEEISLALHEQRGSFSLCCTMGAGTITKIARGLFKKRERCLPKS